jgi:hypothetical protein
LRFRIGLNYVLESAAVGDFVVGLRELVPRDAADKQVEGVGTVVGKLADVPWIRKIIETVYHKNLTRKLNVSVPKT